jgi:CheY-like chemotaxis protein
MVRQTAEIGGPLVLLVEDNERNARLMKEILATYHFRTLVAGDGVQAIRMAQTEHPHLILMDMQLPVLDGLAATRRLKADPETASIPIIALTAHAMPDQRTKLLEAGCCSYISKPFSLHPFLEELSRVLDQHHRVA